VDLALLQVRQQVDRFFGFGHEMGRAQQVFDLTVGLAVAPALPGDVHDLPGLRDVGAALAS